MSYLSKETSLFDRDEKGELIPKDITLELLEDKPIIKAVPLTRGQVQRLYADSIKGQTTKDQDKEIIVKCCKQPHYTEEEIEHMKPKYISAIVTAILSITFDVSQKQISAASLKAITDMAEEMVGKKNSGG